jgi:hypothetical protein
MSDIRTYEEVLLERINKLLVALDSESPEQFDRILEHTEVLLKVKMNLYALFIKWKEYYGKQLLLAYDTTNAKIAMIDDPYNKKLLKEKNEAIAEWGYRLDVLEKLVTLLNDYNLVPFGTPEYAEVQNESVPEQIIEEPRQPQAEQVKSQDELLAEDLARLKQEEAEILQMQQQQAPQKVRFAPRKK